jgi:hypothetical protein
MLLFLIPIAWLAVLTVVVALCQMAARADAAAGPAADAYVRSVCDALVKCGVPPALALTPGSVPQARRPLDDRRPLRSRPRARRRRRVTSHS